MTDPIRVMLADDQALVRGGLRKIVSGKADDMRCHRGYTVAQLDPATRARGHAALLAHRAILAVDPRRRQHPSATPGGWSTRSGRCNRRRAPHLRWEGKFRGLQAE